MTEKSRSKQITVPIRIERLLASVFAFVCKLRNLLIASASDKEVVHAHPEQPGEGKKIIHRGQTAISVSADHGLPAGFSVFFIPASATWPGGHPAGYLHRLR